MAAYRHLYVHVPFCEVICHYCHFYTARTAETDQSAFFRALETELESAASLLAPCLEAVYFGGGTPSATPPGLLAGFLEKLSPRLGPGTEITLEANPSNVTPEKARAWRNAGINRVSLGVQSLDDDALKRLGRVHSARDALAALETCATEIGNVSCDLLYAVPEQGDHEPAAHALRLRAKGASHLSLYHLSLESSHFLHSRLPSDAVAWRQLRRVADALEPLGFSHYEVASFAMPGCESKNNGNYWSGGPYFALGPSAHGFDGLRERWSHVSDWREYTRRTEARESTRAWTETLTDEQRRIEVIFTSLRTSRGLDFRAFRERFGVDLAVTHGRLLERWRTEGFVAPDGEKLVLTFEGRMIADEIARALI